MTEEVNEQAERARLRRKHALEAEAEEQKKHSRRKSAAEQLEDAKAEYAESGRMAVFFEKTTNPNFMIVKGKKVLFASNVPTQDIFILPLDGALGNLGTISQYEGKGWPIVGHANLPPAEKAPNEGIKDIVNHIKMIGTYRKLYAGEGETAPAVGTERKLRSKSQGVHDPIVPTSGKAASKKQMVKELEQTPQALAAAHFEDDEDFNDEDDGIEIKEVLGITPKGFDDGR